MKNYRVAQIFSLVFVLCMLVTTGIFAQTRGELTARIERAQEYMEDILEAPDIAIPQALMKNCHGVIILRQYKAGFVFGVKGGAGIVLVKNGDKGEWSAPAFIKTGEGSFGLQIGGQSVDSIFLIMNQDGMEMLNKNTFKIGIDASAAIGSVGRDTEAKISPKTAILVYSRAKGLYAGASFEGGILLSDDASNEKFYNTKDITVKNILFENKVDMPNEAKPLVSLLNKYIGKTEEK